MDNKISICFTLRNRAEFLDKKLEQLLHQDYDPKDIEICVTDGYSTDNILSVLEKHYPNFYQIKYALSDRKELPFKIESNNPACDRNTQICHQPTFDKIIMTDAEVLFMNANELQFINETLDKPETLLYYKSRFIQNDRNNNILYDPFPITGNIETVDYNGPSALCICMRKSDFIKNRGFDERFAKGFAGEDDGLINWYRHNKNVILSQSRVLHLYHPTQWNEKNRKLRSEITIPLLREFERNNYNHIPNKNNPDWKRPEMLKSEMIFRS